jgi:hypothetical protein
MMKLIIYCINAVSLSRSNNHFNLMLFCNCIFLCLLLSAIAIPNCDIRRRRDEGNRYVDDGWGRQERTVVGG